MVFVRPIVRHHNAKGVLQRERNKMWSSEWEYDILCLAFRGQMVTIVAAWRQHGNSVGRSGCPIPLLFCVAA